VDNIKIDLRGREWDDMDWIELAEDRDQWRALVSTAMKGPERLHNWQLLKKVSAP
jgi:hypothetical protein